VNTRHDIIRINQPFSNHNGGTMRFGPDGHLYIGMGDGGSGNDPQNNAQNPNSLLGKMLRIDVHGDDFPNDPLKNYAIPIDNPFLDGIPISASPEIWAFGLRNPWKFSFDPVTGAMLIADVGQSAREEVNYEPMGAGGRNYGWRMREGFISTGLGGQAYGPLTDPIWDYPRAQGRSITGGYVYRGNALPSFYQGRYFVGDFMDGKMWSLELILDANGEASVGTVLNHNAELGAMGMISSIDVDFMGELYVLDYSGGRILKIVPEPASMLALALGAALVVRRRRSRRA
jgi:glucose/arabinose dehydrogenase